ncbi:GNAT family N-acetyltransferase [Gaoshiqia sp. Z1-71]|uniref:GNAT family N-acetyltransferase n=1 Tax=Gaoshiqia hydrogeniformans TaxID=3290090 RepID=UPI003BF7C09B
MNFSLIRIDLNEEEHCRQLIRLLGLYMQDEMGNGAPMPEELAPQLINGLKQHAGYLGFLALADGQYAALANCNKNFSTFKARPLINIHDFIVDPAFRGQGVGRFLLDAIAGYGRQNGYCRINLEVRHDNLKAQKLYRKAGYHECGEPVFFWEKNL